MSNAGRRRSLLMRVSRFAAFPVIGLAVAGGSLLGSSATADGTSTEPPPIIVHNPASKQLASGERHDFKASAKDASVVLWEVSSDGGSSWNTYGGVNTT
jgi:hypothetical protein